MASIGATMLSATGVVLAETFTCDSTPPCYDTSGIDELYSEQDNDEICGGRGNDSIDASSNDTPGSTDRVYGEPPTI